MQDHLLITKPSWSSKKKKVHFLRKDDTHSTICGLMIDEVLGESYYCTKSKLEVTCKNCKNRIYMQENENEIEKKAKRFLLGHTVNQTNLEDMF